MSVRESAEFISQNSTYVHLGEDASYEAAIKMITPYLEKWKPESWSDHPLHPPLSNDVEKKSMWIFLIDTLNFAFWKPENQPLFTVKYNDQLYTGYWSLCAAIRRAIDEGIPILDSKFWVEATEDNWKQIFKSETTTQILLFNERLRVVREAGKFLIDRFNGSAYEMIRSVNNSAIGLRDLVQTNLKSYADYCTYKERTVYFLKRAQILAADIHYAFLPNNDPVCVFNDIDQITMFADYRVPQILNYLGLIVYSNELLNELRERPHLLSGSTMECEIRGCSIAAVEKLKMKLNNGTMSVLIDFVLWDYATQNRSEMDHIPIHKTESVFY